MTTAQKPEAIILWNRCGDVLPPENKPVETRINDSGGVRNEAILVRHNNLWWFEDMSMYVYYSPTEWREGQS